MSRSDIAAIIAIACAVIAVVAIMMLVADQVPGLFIE
jgi:hypothetical protein